MAPNAPKRRLRLARRTKGLAGWEDLAQMLAVPPTARFWGSSGASNSLITTKLSWHLPSAVTMSQRQLWQLPVGFWSQAKSVLLPGGQQAISRRDVPLNEGGFWGAAGTEQCCLRAGERRAGAGGAARPAQHDPRRTAVQERRWKKKPRVAACPGAGDRGKQAAAGLCSARAC